MATNRIRGSLARQIILTMLVALLSVMFVFVMIAIRQGNQLGRLELRERANRESLQIARMVGETLEYEFGGDDAVAQSINKILDEQRQNERYIVAQTDRSDDALDSRLALEFIGVYLKNDDQGKYRRVADIGQTSSSALVNELISIDNRRPDEPLSDTLSQKFLDDKGLVLGQANIISFSTAIEKDDSLSGGDGGLSAISELDALTAAESQSKANLGKEVTGKVVVILSDHLVRQRNNTTVYIGLGIAMLMAVVLLTLTSLYIRSILKDIAPVTDAAERIADGDMQIDPVVVTASNEIGGMAISFNRMLAVLQEMVSEINSMADGNFTRVGQSDIPGMLGASLKTMGRDIETMIGAIKTIAAQIASASEEIRTITHRASLEMRKQADGSRAMSISTENVATAVTQIAHNGRLVAGSIQSVMDASRDAVNTAQDGGEVVSLTMEMMRKIEESMESTSQKILELGKTTKHIDAMIDTISTIAEQSNLLALNAAIEAAGASGVQTKGFIVVAEEVRKLADRTTEAARVVSNNIVSIQNQTSSVVKEMNRWREDVSKGVEMSERTGAVLKEIIQRNEGLQQRVQEITTAVNEQTIATDEMSRSLAHISETLENSAKIAQELAIGAEQVQNSTEDLATQSINLVRSAERFKTN